jgi:hypothetical protein
MKNIFSCIFIAIIFTSYSFSQDTIKVSLPDNSAPYTDTNEKLGLTKIILNKIIAQSNYKLSISQLINNYSIDLIGLIENVAPYDTNYQFSLPVFLSNYVIVSNKNNKVENVDKIIDDKIGLIEKSFAQKKLDGKLFFFKEFSGGNDAFHSILNKEVNYLIIEKSIAKYYLQQDQFKNNLFIVNDNLFSTEIGFLINKRNGKLISILNSGITNLKKQDEYSKIVIDYFELPHDNTLLWTVIMALSGVFLIVIVILTFRKKKLLGKLTQYYGMRLKGLIIFRSSPTYSSNDNDGSNFKNALNDLQIKFGMLHFNYDYSGNSVKINIQTDKRIFLSDKDFLINFKESLSDTLKEIPKDKYLIEINIKGEFSNINSHNSFLIINKGNEIGLHIEQSKRSFFPNI